MSFSAEWLALRAPADARARDRFLMARAVHCVPANGHVVDLGAGTGATVRALSPLLNGPVRWTLVDADAGLLDAARRALADDGIAVDTLEADLSADPLPVRDADLVTASALFDLVSEAAITRFAAALAATGAPLLALLTFDGILALSPEHPADDAMLDAFRAHQRTDKGFGPAAGPDAPDRLVGALAMHDYAVSVADSAWHLEAPRDRALMDALLDGWADAARAVGVAEETVVDWLAHHRSAHAITVGHADVFAAPPSA